MLMDVFDRIFDADDVATRIFVAMPDHRSQRCRLTGAGCADEYDEATLRHRQRFDDRRQTEFRDFRNVHFDAAQHHADQVALIERADTKTSETTRVDRKVTFVIAFELIL